MEFTQYQFLKQHALEILREGNKTIPPTQEINPIVLAYIGDVVFSMYIRLRLLPTSKQVRVIHDLGSKMVSAKCQCKAMESLEELLDEKEQVVVRRGRNAKSTVPKSASVHEYRMATAFEALLGYLFLEDEEARLEELLDKSFDIITQGLLSK